MNSKMWNVKIVCLILVLSCFVGKCRGLSDFFDRDTSTIGFQEEYEDPHSFYKKPREEEEYEDPHSFYKKSREEETHSFVQQIGKYIGGDISSKDHCGPCEDELRLCKINIRNRPMHTDIADELLSRRFVNTILSRAKLVKDGEMFSGHLNLEFTEVELRELREFGKGRLTLRQIDPILNNVIKAPIKDPVFETFKFMVDLASLLYSISLILLSFAIENKEITACILSTLSIIIFLKGKRYNLYKLLTFGTVIIFILSFFITWWKLIQNATINHSTLQMKYLELPEHCQSDASFWTSIRTFFRSPEDCKNYIAARTKNPFLDVTPAQALSHMLSHVIFEPIAIMGKAIAAFLQHVTTDMSPLLGGIVQIMICILCLPVLIITVILLAGGSLTLGSFGPLSFLSLSGAKKTKKERNRAVNSRIQRRPVEIILKVQASGQSAGNSSIGAPDQSKMLSLDNEPEKPKTKSEIDASTSKSIKHETVGSGDDLSSADNSESEDRSADAEASESGGSDVKESREIGSGDHA